MLNKILLVASVVVMGMLGGCAASPAKIISANLENAHKLAKDNSGVVYGVAFPGSLSGLNVSNVCESIKNDDRCNHQADFSVVVVIPVVGLSSGPIGVIALSDKKSNLHFCTSTWNDDCTFVKVHADLGMAATIIEVASLSGEKKCHWVGLQGMGGTVCSAYNWDYRKDLRSADSSHVLTGNGVVTVSDK